MKRLLALIVCLPLVGCDRTPGSYLKCLPEPKLEQGWARAHRKGIDFSFAVPPGWIPLKIDADRLGDDELFPSEPVGFQTLLERISRRKQAIGALNGDILNLGVALIVSQDAGRNLVLKTEGDDLEREIRSIPEFEVLGRENVELPVGKAIRIKAQMREASTQYHAVMTGYALVDGHTGYLALFLGLTGGADNSLPTRRIMATFRPLKPL